MPAPAPWARTKQALLDEGARSRAEMLLPDGKAMRSGVTLPLIAGSVAQGPAKSCHDLEFVFCRSAAAGIGAAAVSAA